MPELAAVYSLGFVLCLALTVVYVFLRDWRRHTPAVERLQTNLRKAGFYWNDSRDAVMRWENEASEAENKKSQVAIGYTGLILALLSWVGIVFLLIIMLSERFFARTRRERRLFSSSLTKQIQFSADQVQVELDQLDVFNDRPTETARPI